jgi:hypothetical protein
MKIPEIARPVRAEYTRNKRNATAGDNRVTAALRKTTTMIWSMNNPNANQGSKRMRFMNSAFVLTVVETQAVTAIPIAMTR